MSVSYYRLRSPFTSARLEEGPGHDRLSLWESHALSGVLTLTKGKGREALLAFTETETAFPPAHSWYGGKGIGTQISFRDSELADLDCMVSETGEIFTVAELKARTREGA